MRVNQNDKDLKNGKAGGQGGGIGESGNSDTSGIGGGPNPQDASGIGGGPNPQDASGIGGDEPFEHMSEETKAKRMSKIRGNTTFQETTTKIVNGETISRTRSWTEEPIKPKNINYGEHGSSIEEIATGLYGKEKAKEHYEDLAKALVSKDNFDKEAEFGKYKIDLNVGKNHSEDLGRYIANNGLQDNKETLDYIESLKGNTKGNIKLGIDKQLDEINKTNILNKSLEEVDNKYLDKINDLDTDEYKNIFRKLNNGVELNNEEVESFKNAKNLFNEVENEFKEAGSKAGKNVSGDIFQNIEDVKNFNTVGKNNATYRSIKSVFGIKGENGNDGYTFVNPNDYEITENNRVIPKAVQAETQVDIMSTLNDKRDFITAKENFSSEYGNIENYLDKTGQKVDDLFVDGDAKKLYELNKAGVTGDNATEMLDAYATTKAGNLGELNSTVNGAISKEANKYNISSENIGYIGADGFNIENKNGNFSVSQNSINLLTDEEKKTYESLINSKNVGQEKLEDLAKTVNRRIEENEVEDIVNANLYKGSAESSINMKLNNDYTGDRGHRLKNSTTLVDGVENYGDFQEFYEANKNTPLNKLGNVEIPEPKYKQTAYSTLMDTPIEDGAKNLEYNFQGFYNDYKNAPLSDVEKNVDRYKQKLYLEEAKQPDLLTQNNFLDYEDSRRINKDRISYKQISESANEKYKEFNKIETDATYGLSQEEILSKSGIDKKYAKEISEAGSFDDISPKARLGLYNSTNKLSEAEMNLGKVTSDDWKEIYKNNGKLFEGVDSTDQKGMAEKLFSFAKNKDRVGAGMKVHMTGADINNAEEARAFVNNLVKDGEISFEKVGEMFAIENRDHKGNLGDIVTAGKTGNIEEYLKQRKRNSAVDALAEKLEYIQKEFGDSKEFAGSDTINKITDKLKNPKNFSKEQIGQLDSAIEKAKDFTDDIQKISGSGETANIKKGLSTLKSNTALKIGGAIGAAMLIGGIANNASEERRRKREEMNQLLAAQSANMRGGY